MAIEYNDYFKNLRDDDVISLFGKLYKLGEVKDSINDFIESREHNRAPYYLSEKFKRDEIQVSHNDSFNLLTDGVDSEILRIASDGWKKGKLKIKVSVEFIPEEPEIPEYQSPLDEIRNHPSFPSS
jgi:hypothetical protein